LFNLQKKSCVAHCHAVLSVLELDFANQKRIRKPEGYFKHLATAAQNGTLIIPEEVIANQDMKKLEHRILSLKAEWKAGHKITANGKPLKIDPCPFVYTAKGQTTIALLISQGVDINSALPTTDK